MYIYACIHAHVWLHRYTHAHMHACTHVYMYIYIHALHVHIYACIHAHMHTYIICNFHVFPFSRIEEYNFVIWQEKPNIEASSCCCCSSFTWSSFTCSVHMLGIIYITNPKHELLLLLLLLLLLHHVFLHHLQTSIMYSAILKARTLFKTIFLKTGSHDGSAHTFRSSHQFLEVAQKGV